MACGLILEDEANFGQAQRPHLRLVAADGNHQGAGPLHNSLWQKGNVPITLQRWELLGEDDEIRKLW